MTTLTRTDESKIEMVKELYKAGFSQTYIEKNLHMTRKTIRTILKENSLIRSKSEQWRLRYNSKLNTKVFDKLTPEAYYWLGFLYADGHISSGKRGYNIELGVHSKDKEHLKKFLNFMNCNNKITKDKRSKYYRVRIGSKELHDKLMSFGFNNEKSKNANPHYSLLNSRDFWRGVVDGDGSLSYVITRNYPFIHLCGTLKTTEEFANFIKRNGILSMARPHDASTKLSTQPFYQISYSSNKAKQIGKLLYEDSEIYLDRKYEIYKQYF